MRHFYTLSLTVVFSLFLTSCIGAHPSVASESGQGVVGESGQTEVKQADVKEAPPWVGGDEEAFFYYALGQLDIQDQRWDEAERAFANVVETDKSAVDARIFASHLAVQRGDVQRAEAYTREVVNLDPTRVKSRMLLASLLTAQEKHQEAAEQYELLLARDDQDGSARLLLGQTYGYLKDGQKAKEILKPLFSDKKMAWKAYLTLGRAMVSIPQLEEAAVAFRKSHELAPERMQPVMALGVVLQKLDRSTESEKLYRDYLSEFPENRAIHSRLGRLLLNQNNRDGALEEFRAISNLSPSNVQARLTTGLILLSEHRYDEALQELRLAEASEPNNSTVQYYIGQSLEFLNTPKAAEVAYLKIAADQPFHSEAQLRLAHLETSSGRTDSALQRVRQLIKEHPEQVAFLKALSIVQLQAGQYEEAIDTASQGLAISPDNSELRFNRAMAYDKLNVWSKAEEDLRLYIERNPNDAHALNYLGYTWAEKNIYLEESRQLLERAAQLAPEDGFVTDSLGWVLYRLKDYKESLTRMKKAVRLEPTDPTIHEHLGDVFSALGEKEKALEIWKKALELGPDNKKLQEKIEKNAR